MIKFLLRGLAGMLLCYGLANGAYILDHFGLLFLYCMGIMLLADISSDRGTP